MFITGMQNRLGRGFVVLAPPTEATASFDHVLMDPARHRSLLDESQRLRGKIYLKDGAIQQQQLTSDGRHVQDIDDQSWHLLTLDRNGRVNACIRYTAHNPGASFGDLGLRHVLQHQPSHFADLVERTVASELSKASRLGFTYVELGGWVVEEELRCSTEAIRMLLMMYALSQSMGGAIALGTATTRHNSSSILRRTGGRSLGEGRDEVPTYYDPVYKCEMEMIAFDSRFPNPRYSGWIREFREALQHIPILTPMHSSTTQGLLNLHSAVGVSSMQESASLLVA